MQGSLGLLGLLLLISLSSLKAQQHTDSIRLNQVGFYPHGPKRAVVLGAKPGKFFIVTADLHHTVYTGYLRTTPGKKAFVADFSAFQAAGTYSVQVPGIGLSHPFQVRGQVHAEVARAALKSYYFQRASTALPPRYAGQWSRSAGHPDTAVLVHPSAASVARPSGTVLHSPRGWYDAGDYNKYVVNSGITLGTLLALYEDFPAYCERLRTNIPESTNQLPDVLDESLWNLRWLLSMQDPHDGGVYHKLTNASFDAMVMPAAARSPRYLVQKSTAATLDFAAVMAQASRITRRFAAQVPGLADSCLRAATSAWQWAEAHPQLHYRQAEINRKAAPVISTGEYGDEDLSDEALWAATELYITTGQAAYFEAMQPALRQAPAVPSWGQVQALAFYTLARFRPQLPTHTQQELKFVDQQLLALADTLVAGGAQRPYQTPMGHRLSDFNWGSNANAANQGVVLIQAFRLSGNRQYLRAALDNLDYLLGRNATGYSFVTGFGSKPPQFPHHRPSAADNVVAPVPGLLVGGPNPGRQDGCQYPSQQPDQAYVDQLCSYASNEVAINWNAPLVYLSSALEALADNLDAATRRSGKSQHKPGGQVTRKP
ncbi:cellulase [Hymenobacter sp. BT18]|uniref:glycoside hydrolase family 9 protein n=1 Tax=Hymenobacter sp. BT18 TaxID=2835648 RepID=UPI00143E27A2|nr:glycoside hydrolase family 9 protein [Hymenobacter sp. BT18]QIX60120.1 cellulase [Hymenobacter sp. BT18]